MDHRLRRWIRDQGRGEENAQKSEAIELLYREDSAGDYLTIRLFHV